MTNATTIKRKIEEKLRALAPATLRTVVSDDFREPFMRKDIEDYPAAIIASPAIENDYLDNRTNLRTYTTEILVITKGEDTTAEDIEELAETIINAFDDDETLGGTADGGVEPAVGAPAAQTDGAKTWVAFTVTVRAKASKTIA